MRRIDPIPWPLAIAVAVLVLFLFIVGVRAARAQERPASYIVIQSVFVASAGFDLASTLYYYPRCKAQGCTEQNSLLAPAMKAGPLPTIIVAAALTTVTVWAADRVWQHEKVGRHVWWLIPVAGTLNHLLAARANILLMRGR